MFNDQNIELEFRSSEPIKTYQENHIHVCFFEFRSLRFIWNLVFVVWNFLLVRPWPLGGIWIRIGISVCLSQWVPNTPLPATGRQIRTEGSLSCVP